MTCTLCYVQKHLQELDASELLNMYDLVVSEMKRRSVKE